MEDFLLFSIPDIKQQEKPENKPRKKIFSLENRRKSSKIVMMTLAFYFSYYYLLPRKDELTVEECMKK
jgi:hypothetical protein